MIEIVILLLLLIVLFILAVKEVVSLVRWYLHKQKNTLTAKQGMRLKKNSILLVAAGLLTGGFILFSQMTASTPPIQDENGKPVRGSIAQLRRVDLNGRQEWISIRGENSENPLLLFLAGGPGGTQMAAVRHDLAALEKHFVVVGWDQPGSGKSCGAGGKSLIVDTYVEDGLALTEYLSEQFKQEKIYLVGESWGSALGVFMAAAAPERYHAVIGTGQMIDFLETENTDYDKAIAIAQSRGDTGKIQKLVENGRPPYYGSDVTWKSAEYLNYLSSYMSSNPEIHNGGYNTFRDISSSEYGVIDKINFLLGLATTFSHVYPQLYDVDLRTDFPKLEVPVYFFLGRHDINAPSSLVEDYASLLEAPHKEIVWFEHSGHSPWINESDKFVIELLSILE